MYQGFMKSQQWYRLCTEQGCKVVAYEIEKVEVTSNYFLVFGKEKTVYSQLGHKGIFSAPVRNYFQ